MLHAQTDEDQPGYLTTYLRDHHAGSVGARALIDRMIRANRQQPLGPALEELRAALEEDAEQAARVADVLDVSRSLLKDTAARSAVLLGGLKPNRHLRRYSPLSRLLELEGLRAGVAAKLCLWRALKVRAGHDARLAGFDLPRLEHRALEQLDTIDRWHAWAAEQLMAD